jgi:NADH:ubiquinone oxidoreductase subunit 2 (subunit N)
MDAEEQVEGNDTTGARVELESLLTPSVQRHQPRLQQMGARPWRLSSQVWIAFFGGVLSIAIISYLNGQRLRLSPQRMRQIILVGVVGLIAVIITTYLLGQAGLSSLESAQRTQLRLVNRVIAVIAYLILVRLQRPADRQYQAFSDEYDSLWIPGLLAIFVAGTLQNLLVFGLAGLL